MPKGHLRFATVRRDISPKKSRWGHRDPPGDQDLKAFEVWHTRAERAVQRGGGLTPLHRGEPSLSGKDFTKGCCRFGGFDAGHAAEVDGAFAQKARAAIDFVAQDLMKVAQR